MRFVATLIGPAAGSLTDSHIIAARKALGGLGAKDAPPEWLAELIRAADGYTPGTRVILLVPGLGMPWPQASAPEHYVQRIADLLQAPAEAIVSVTAGRSLAAGRAVFSPQPPALAAD